MASSGGARRERSSVMSLPSSAITWSDTQFSMASCIMLSVKPRLATSCMIVSKRTVPPLGPVRRWTAVNTMS
eukprot:10728435-Lingulodinium_polyedra.AAC.1